MYTCFAHQPRHSLITAHILPPDKDDEEEQETEKEKEEGEARANEDVGIKVTTFPGEIQGCVIVHTDEHVETHGLLAGDRFVVFAC